MLTLFVAKQVGPQHQLKFSNTKKKKKKNFSEGGQFQSYSLSDFIHILQRFCHI